MTATAPAGPHAGAFGVRSSAPGEVRSVPRPAAPAPYGPPSPRRHARTDTDTEAAP